MSRRGRWPRTSVGGIFSHKDGHDLVRKKHSLSGEAQSRWVEHQDPLVHEGLQIAPEPLPHVDAVAPSHCLEVDAATETQAGEQGVAEALGRRRRVNLDADRLVPGYALNVVLRGGHV